MNATYRKASAAILSTALIVLSACQGTTVDNSSTPTLTTSDSDSLSLISEFPLQETLYTASRSYKVTASDDSSLVWYVSLNTSIQWPEALGKYKIDNLRDSILQISFGLTTPKNVKEAITKSITDLERYGLDGTVEVIDTIPANAQLGQFYANKAVQLIECTQQTVTYSATTSEFMGGAHPNSSAIPFTFVLAEDCPVTMEYLFVKGAIKELEPKLIEAIAAAHSVSTDEIRSALINSPVTITNNVYIMNGNIAFHFNPYDILPYSYGPSEAFIQPDEVESLLTPAAKKLLLE